MPVSRKSVSASANGSPLRPAVDPLPRRIVLFAVIRDESGSMRMFRQKQGEFIPAVAASLIEAGGPKVGELVYVLYVVVSGGVVATDFAPLGKAQDPAFNPDGQTPIGQALSAAAEKVEAFLQGRVFPDEVTVRNFEVLIVSDLQATGETPEETEAGVEKFVAMAKTYRAKVNLIGPDPEVMNEELAARLDVSERGIKFLDTDPSAVLQVTFDSLLNASRKLMGSNPSIRIQ
jgi:hypothetical protein